MATLTACFVNSNRDPKKGQPAKPADFFYFPPVEEVHIPASTANAFFSLVSDGAMPSWAVAIAPISKLSAARTHHPLPKLRALIGEGIILLCPHIKRDKIESGLAILGENIADTTTLIDPDTNTSYQVASKNLIDSAWILDFEIITF